MPPSSSAPARALPLVALATALALLAAACSGGGEPAASPSPSPTPSPSPSPTPTALAPLTGEPVDAAVGDRPVLAVKVENTEAAEPQAGLAAADVVFEELVEGGVTRFVALFHTELPERIGPVRSARLVDVELLPAYRPVFAHSGARGEVSAALRSAGLGMLTEGSGQAFRRDPSRPGSHDLFASGPQLVEQGRGLDGVEPLTAPVWRFDEQPVSPCEGCHRRDTVTMTMSGAVTVTWTWEPVAEVYRRTQNGGETRLEGDAEVGAANVLALGMRVGEGGCCDTAGNPYTVTEVVGSGEGLLLRGGRAIPVTWSKDAPDEHLRVSDGSGAAVPLAPGPTWVQLMPTANVPQAGTQ